MADALGLIEVMGLAAGLEAADAAVKSANVELIGYELVKGGGMVVIKMNGDVGAVQAAVEAAAAAASRIGKVYSKHVIPRPATGLEKIIFTPETVGQKPVPQQPAPPPEPTPTDQQLPIEEPILLEQLTLPEEETLSDEETLSEEEEEEMLSEEETPTSRNVTGLEQSPKASCNLCGDPACPRKKGEPRVTCLHYNEEEKEEK